MVHAKAIVASMALMASAVAAQGYAIIVNQCENFVNLAVTPSSDGVHTPWSTTIDPNDQWTQQWTALENGGGWSLKLYPWDGTIDNIMQYEYTFQSTDNGTIWYDLSDVNGNPWDGNWEITAVSASSTCEPKQAAYRYATDDAYGMQSCDSDASITVTLCSGESQDDAGAASASSSAAAATSSAAATSASAVSAVESVSSYSTTSSSSTSTSTSSTHSTSETEAAVSTTAVSVTPTSTVAQTTTLATSVIVASSSTSDGVPVGIYETVYQTEVHTVTQFATQTEDFHHWPREATPAPHAHRHAARHPHAH